MSAYGEGAIVDDTEFAKRADLAKKVKEMRNDLRYWVYCFDRSLREERRRFEFLHWPLRVFGDVRPESEYLVLREGYGFMLSYRF